MVGKMSRSGCCRILETGSYIETYIDCVDDGGNMGMGRATINSILNH